MDSYRFTCLSHHTTVRPNVIIIILMQYPFLTVLSVISMALSVRLSAKDVIFFWRLPLSYSLVSVKNLSSFAVTARHFSCLSDIASYVDHHNHH